MTFEYFIVYLSLILSVLAGGLFVLLVKPVKGKGMKLFLAFGGAYLLSISFLHLLPEVYESTGSGKIGIYVLVGFLFQLLLEYFSEGIEHGHVHHHDHNESRFPLLLMVSLGLHAFVEGIPLEREIHGEVHVGHDHSEHSLLLGVVLHNIPVAIALVTMFLHAGINRMKTFAYLSVFALMGPLGLLFGHQFGDEIAQNLNGFFDISLAIVVGMFMHISTTILFESSEGHRFNAAKLAAILVGVGVALAVL